MSCAVPEEPDTVRRSRPRPPRADESFALGAVARKDRDGVGQVAHCLDKDCVALQGSQLGRDKGDRPRPAGKQRPTEDADGRRRRWRRRNDAVSDDAQVAATGAEAVHHEIPGRCRHGDRPVHQPIE